MVTRPEASRTEPTHLSERMPVRRRRCQTESPNNEVRLSKAPPRALPLDINGREGERLRCLRLFESGIVQLARAIRTQITKCVDQEGRVLGAMKPIGDEFTQQLGRFKNAQGNNIWKSLQKQTKGLTANGLRHSYAYRAHNRGGRMDVFTAANLMGHDAMTHIKHYA